MTGLATQYFYVQRFGEVDPLYALRFGDEGDEFVTLVKGPPPDVYCPPNCDGMPGGGQKPRSGAGERAKFETHEQAASWFKEHGVELSETYARQFDTKELNELADEHARLESLGVKMENVRLYKDLQMASVGESANYKEAIPGSNFDFKSIAINPIELQKGLNQERGIQGYERSALEKAFNGDCKGHVDLSLSGVYRHEVAHQVFWQLPTAYQHGGKEYNIREQVLRQYEGVRSHNGSSYIRNKLSLYADQNGHEYFAEVFTKVTSKGYKKGSYPEDHAILQALSMVGVNP